MTQGVGTACWLAPEVINYAHASKDSDVYAFGIVLWEVFTRFALLLLIFITLIFIILIFITLIFIVIDIYCIDIYYIDIYYIDIYYIDIYYIDIYCDWCLW